METKYFSFLAVIGAMGGVIAQAFGGWTSALTTLVIVMGVDYITGLIVAGVFHRSGKSKTGKLNSCAGFKGLCKKGVMLLIVLVAARLDIMIGTCFIKDCCVISFICNETISITENAGLMGIPIPQVITKAIDVLKSKEEKEV